MFTNTSPANEIVFDLVRRKRRSGQGSPSEQAFGYSAGDVIQGRYELLRVLARGGMSAVWVAQDLVLDAQFALKLQARDNGEAHGAERMLREARAAAAIDHPGVIKVFDYGITEQDDPFIVMELLLGETIEQKISEHGRMTPVEAVRLVLPVADALAVAHARGIVHRDIKPENIVCVADELGRIHPKLLDFGVAKRIGRDSQRITLLGTVVGTPEYISPEQATDDPNVDQRCDIWSFSVVLYEMLTGQTPFYRPSVSAILKAIVQDPVVPLARYGVEDPELANIVLRGLRKFPQARWESMQSYGRALAEWLVRYGVEDDVANQSLRSAWLGGTPPPPRAAPQFDTERPVVHQRTPILPAPEDAIDLPKKSFLRSATGLALCAATFGLLIAGAIYTASALESPNPDPSPASTEPEPATPGPAASAAPLAPATSSSGNDPREAAPTRDTALDSGTHARESTPPRIQPKPRRFRWTAPPPRNAIPPSPSRDPRI